MGYCVDMVDSEFVIFHQNVMSAYDALFARLRNSDQYGSVRNCLTLEAIMNEIRWPIEFDGEGNIVGIEFEGEKYWDDEQIFEALAPFVKDGSFIHMRGEDGEQWRWIFQHGRLRQITAKTVWDYCEGCRHKGQHGQCAAEPGGLNVLFEDACSMGSHWEPGIRHHPNVTRENGTPIHRTGFHS